MLCPVANGIVEKGSITKCLFSEMIIEQIFFDISKKSSMLQLRQISDERVTAEVPAELITLAEPQSMKDRNFKEVRWDERGIGLAHTVFACIKRAVMITLRKNESWHQRNLCPANPFTRQLLGFNGSKKTVSISTFNKNQSYFNHKSII